MISIILPSYNRSSFLDEAFLAIQTQTYTNWELIFVDDGSTDGTRELVNKWSRAFNGKLNYIYQDNQGAYAARKTGLDHATGDYIAFYDADDLWLPHHLEACVAELKKHHNVDWVAARDKQLVIGNTSVDIASLPMQELPNSITELRSKIHGKLQIFADHRLVKTIIDTAHSCGFQRSLIRKEVFENTKFVTKHRNGEDRMFLLRSLKNGFRLAYLHDVHLIYRIHKQNSSAIAQQKTPEATNAVYRAIIEGYRDLFVDCDLSRDEKRALRNRISKDTFWALGYHGNWRIGRQGEALKIMGHATRENPFHLQLRRSYFGFWLRHKLGIP